MRDRTQLHPRLQSKIKELILKSAKAGLLIGIGECVRTVEEQDALYAQGRTEPGNIVTNAKGSTYSSMHQWGIAFDFYRNDGQGLYNDSDAFFRQVGKIGKSIGLEWGGDWTSPVDKPHFQLPDWGSTPAKLKAMYGTPEKFRSTWEVEEVTQEQFNKMMDTYLAERNKATVSDWAKEDWEKAKAAGLTDGTMPQAFATREQVVSMLNRIKK